MGNRAKIFLVCSILFICTSFYVVSWGEDLRYFYDDYNRTIQIRYEDGTIVDYLYDGIGNRTQITTTAPNPNGRLRIGTTPYGTLQDAYDVAGDGSTIKCQSIRFVENLTVNQNKTVTIEGGYDASYTTNYGTTSTLQGMINTTAGGGKLIIKNFIIGN